MPPPGRRREQLIDRRKHLGFTQESLAQALEVSTSSIAQWERGAGTPTPRHRRKLADLMEIGLHGLDQLLDPDGGPVLIEGHVVPPFLEHLISLEQGAGEIRAAEVALVPGILQVRGYADALMRAYFEPTTEYELTARLEARLARQQALVRAEQPLHFRAVLDESVLLRQTGTGEAMVEQLEHLAAVSTLPNVDLQILPLDAMAHGALLGPFWLPVKPGASEPFMVCIENAMTIDYGEIASMVDKHVRLFSYLERTALDAEGSRQRIHEAKKRYR